MLAGESTILYVGKLYDAESPKTTELIHSSVKCGNPVDWIRPPPLGQETHILIQVRVPQDVLDDTCFVQLELTDNNKIKPINVSQ